jgi:hypothetical protein
VRLGVGVGHLCSEDIFVSVIVKLPNEG